MKLMSCGCDLGSPKHMHITILNTQESDVESDTVYLYSLDLGFHNAGLCNSFCTFCYMESMAPEQEFGTRSNIKIAWDDLVMGIKCGYPICCVLEFCMRAAVGQREIGVITGCNAADCDDGYVHCVYHRWRRHPKLALKH